MYLRNDLFCFFFKCSFDFFNEHFHREGGNLRKRLCSVSFFELLEQTTASVRDLDIHNKTNQYTNFLTTFAYYAKFLNREKFQKLKARALHLGSSLRFAGVRTLDGASMQAGIRLFWTSKSLTHTVDLNLSHCFGLNNQSPFDVKFKLNRNKLRTFKVFHSKLLYSKFSIKGGTLEIITIEISLMEVSNNYITSYIDYI